MTLIEFIKTQTTQETAIGDLARDIVGDKEFPRDRTEEGIVSYIEFKTRYRGTSDTFEEMMAAYQQVKDRQISPEDLEANFAVLRSEQWDYYKSHFRSDKAIIVGEAGDIYRVFAVDSKHKNALRFDIYTRSDLNDIQLVTLDRVNNGALTKKVSISDAISALQENVYTENKQPTQPNYSELIDYLQTQLI